MKNEIFSFLISILIFKSFPIFPQSVPPSFYIIPEDNFVADILDSIVAKEEVEDTFALEGENIFSLDFNDLNMTYHQTLGDLLRLLPGMYINDFGLYGNRQSMRLFSYNPNQVTLLLNGLPLGYTDYLGTNLYMLPLQSIKRIEVIPFASSLDYALPSSAGTVNIITRGFSHSMPFYTFGTLSRENREEYVGHLHFAQRIYRNINFYMSSLLKRNTNEEIDYNAIQYNFRLDLFLRKNWQGSFYSFSSYSMLLSFVRKNLTKLKSMEYDEKEKIWSWTKKDLKRKAFGEILRLAIIREKEGYLVAGINSLERATALRTRLSKTCGDAISFESMESKSLDALPKLSTEKREQLDQEQKKLADNPEVQVMLVQRMNDYYLNEWIRTRVPALGNITPQAAAKTQKGREKLRVLLNDFEHKDRLLYGDKRQRMNWDLVRKKLGI